MPEIEGLAWKRKIRAAHHWSMTRIISQVYESLDSGESLNLLCLRQQKSQLSGKVDVLSKLDDEGIEMVAEHEFDRDGEQADIIKEKIGLFIMDIDQALESASTRTVTDTASGTSCTTSPTKDPALTRTHSERKPLSPPSTETAGDLPSLPSPTDQTDSALTLPPQLQELEVPLPLHQSYRTLNFIGVGRIEEVIPGTDGRIRSAQKCVCKDRTSYNVEATYTAPVST